MSEPILTMTSAEAGQRLDRYLRKLLRQVPLGAIMKHLRSGRIRVDGSKALPSLRLEAGMKVELRLPAADLAAVAEAGERASAPTRKPGFELEIVYEDEDVLVIDKPSGLAVHAGTGNERRSVVSWLRASGRGLRTATFSPAPAHRLDRQTSGLCALGLTPRGLQGLTAAFREGRASKIYLAVVHGSLEPDHGTIDAPLLVVPAASAREPKVIVDSTGKPARTDFEVLAKDGRRTLVRLGLHTGRMHQIRVHLAHLGHAVVGDRRYGRGGGRESRLCLHAERLEFPHPVSGEPVRLHAVAPPALRVGPQD